MNCKIFWFFLFCAIQTNAFAGVIIGGNSEILIHKSNYEYFIGDEKPDLAVAFLIRSVAWDKALDSTLRQNTDSNKVFLNHQLKIKNITFFRLFFKNDKGVYRYIDLSVTGKLIADANIINGLANSIEIQKFYQSGAVLSRTSYLFIPPLKERTDYHSVSWYGKTFHLIKNGTEKIFYANNSLRIEREYIDGRLKDTLYTEFNADGSVYETYTILNGSFLNLKLFDKKQPANKKAYLFGIDNYSAPEGIANKTLLPKINSTNDINLIKETLIKNRGFKEKDISLITGDSATKEYVIRSFQRFLNSLKKGDIVFIHFSGHGLLIEDSAVQGGLAFMLPCRDIWKFDFLSGKDFSNIHLAAIMQGELEKFLHSAQSQVGVSGQVFLSLDASHSGTLFSDFNGGNKDSADTKTFKNLLRGEKNNLLFNFVTNPDAPSYILTSTSSDEVAREMMDKTGKSFGAYSYALCHSLSNPAILNSQELVENIADSIRPYQNPGYLARETQFLFENGESGGYNDDMVSLPRLNLRGKAYSVSVGISKYNFSGTKLHFENCVSDASAYASYFSSQYIRAFKDDDKTNLISTLLLNENATKEKIIEAINNAISNTRPEDYFIFNFSGYCKPLADSTGKNITWFVPSGLNNISDDKEIRQKGISLIQLKDLLQLIPANNQLFITEAGSTPDFQREFIQALIETSPTIASLSNKNRIFIVPKSSGIDNCNCNNKLIEHGPLNYYITNLSNDLNIFGLFDDSLYASAIKFDLNKQEAECNYFRTGYFDIFFEKDFVKDLKYFLPEDVMQTRGPRLINLERDSIASAIGRRFALVVGTNVYTGKPDWQDLDNPVLDGKDIANSLQNNFRFDVKLLLDKPADSIYNQILWYSQQLKPSDQLLIYIAGHGDFDDRLFDDGFIVCNNSNTLKNDPYRNSYIQYSKLSRMINRLPPRQILMVLDVCFGGTFDERVARNKSRGREDYSDLPTDIYFQEKMKKRTRLYLTSGGKREVPDGYKGKHSPFANRLLQALDAKGGASKILTASNLFQFVNMLPSGPLLGSFGDDEPGSEFVLLGN